MLLRKVSDPGTTMNKLGVGILRLLYSIPGTSDGFLAFVQCGAQ